MSLFDPVPEGQSRLKIVIAYDGTGFHGFAPQPDVRTVAGDLVTLAKGTLPMARIP